MHPVVLFAAAGTIAGTGVSASVGGGWYLWKRAQQEAARRLQSKDVEAAQSAIADGITLSEVRRDAKAAGVDPDQAVAGYTRLRDGQLSLHQVLTALREATSPGE